MKKRTIYLQLVVMGMLVASHMNYAIAQDCSENTQAMCVDGCKREHIVVQPISLLPLLQEIVIHQSAQPDDNESLNSIFACMERLEHGYTNLHLDELIKAMPILLSYTTSSHRWFWSAPATNNDSVDLTEVLRLLSIIRNRIGNVFQDPSALTILGTLGNPLELGSNENIIRQLLRIQGECSETRAMIDALKESVIACCAQLADQIITNNNALDALATLVTDGFQSTFTTLTTYSDTTNIAVNAPSTIIVNDTEHSATMPKKDRGILSLITNW